MPHLSPLSWYSLPLMFTILSMLMFMQLHWNKNFTLQLHSNSKSKNLIKWNWS